MKKFKLLIITMMLLIGVMLPIYNIKAYTFGFDDTHTVYNFGGKLYTDLQLTNEITLDTIQDILDSEYLGTTQSGIYSVAVQIEFLTVGEVSNNHPMKVYAYTLVYELIYDLNHVVSVSFVQADQYYYVLDIHNTKGANYQGTFQAFKNSMNGLIYPQYEILKQRIYQQGYQTGYDDGYDDGISITYDELYESRYQQGLDDGYDNGYDDGKDDGIFLGMQEYGIFYDNSWLTAEQYGTIRYNKGIQFGVEAGENFNFGSLLTQIFVGMGSLLSIDLLPGISIGAIIAVPLVFGIIYFIIGKKRGDD
ncbi:MAG: hypothetical protein QXI16_04185 [Sulfolobaceae archaeon]